MSGRSSSVLRPGRVGRDAVDAVQQRCDPLLRRAGAVGRLPADSLGRDLQLRFDTIARIQPVPAKAVAGSSSPVSKSHGDSPRPRRDRAVPRPTAWCRRDALKQAETSLRKPTGLWPRSCSSRSWCSLRRHRNSARCPPPRRPRWRDRPRRQVSWAERREVDGARYAGRRLLVGRWAERCEPVWCDGLPVLDADDEGARVATDRGWLSGGERDLVGE